jgi:hypothetical protein
MSKGTNSPKTIHTSRTMMFDELSNLINQGIYDEQEILEINTLHKSTKGNLEKTLKYLSRIYDFKTNSTLWKVFLFLWRLADDENKRFLALLHALKNDELLKLSIPVVKKTSFGDRVEVKEISEILSKTYPEKYSPRTLLSAAQNINSSWKQGGFVQGKVKSIRVDARPDYSSILFALYLGMEQGLTGDELVESEWATLFDINETKIRELVSEAAMRDLIDYRYSGGITVIDLDTLISKAKNEIEG